MIQRDPQEPQAGKVGASAMQHRFQKKPRVSGLKTYNFGLNTYSYTSSLKVVAVGSINYEEHEDQCQGKDLLTHVTDWRLSRIRNGNICDILHNLKQISRTKHLCLPGRRVKTVTLGEPTLNALYTQNAESQLMQAYASNNAQTDRECFVRGWVSWPSWGTC